jgi:type I restriction enzyme S subunit
MNGQATVSDETNCDRVANFAEIPKTDDERFSLWLQNQGIAARGELDRKTLREIFNAMDDDDK